MKKDQGIPTTLEPTVRDGIAIPEKSISLEKAVNYYNNFYNTRILHDPSDSTRAVWFEFSMLERYFKEVVTTCEKRNITITRFVFLLGADPEGKRTVFLAPATYDAQLDLHRAFSLDNDEITFLYRFPGENYSTITAFEHLQSTDQSLILSNKGHISSAEAIALYNHYYDVKTGPFTPVVPLDTRFVYYEKGEFEAYLSYLKAQSSAHDIALDGIHMVFAAIEDIEEEGPYANHITLFFAPTKNGSNEKLVSSLDMPEDTVLDVSKRQWEFPTPTINPTQITAFFNHGSGAPPPHHWD
ncbi:MAG: hypothetical protein AAF717_11985 [Bacteroidota bacterium]